MKKFALAAALLVAALVALAPEARAEVYEKGKLTHYSPVSKQVRPGAFYEMHVVTLQAGTTYTIDLRSPDFDAYLVLTDKHCCILVKDDDSGGGLDARIVFRPQYTGEYKIFVTTYRIGEVGNYSLLVRP
jgi:hypothetical protein